MADGRVAQRLIRSIERYQDRGVARRRRRRCNFEPSCSHFSQEALRTRPLPVAIAVSVWRIVRCNSTLGVRTRDPVARRAERRLRPNTLATLFGAMSVLGLAVVAAQAVGAQSISGGCKASVNGRDPTSMTAKDPLVVHKGEKVTVSGTVPASAASSGNITSLTKIKVSIVGDLVAPSYEQHPGTGPQWGGSVNVDNYLKYGVGLYKVDGSSSGQPGWSCSGDGYVELRDGSPLGKPIGQAAAGMAVVGGLGALVAAGTGRKAPDVAATADYDAAPTADEVKKDFKSDAEKLLGIEDKPPPQRDLPLDYGVSAGCGFAAFVGVMILAAASDSPILFIPAMAMVASGAPLRRRIWVRGRPVLGFFSGLIAGLGIAVLLQQYAYWTLTISTAIVFPVLVAVLTTVRAWRGRPFKTVAA